MNVQHQEIIAASLEGYLEADHPPYPRPLPPGLAAWYCYCIDGGHSVVVILESDYDATAEDPGVDLFPYLLTASVKTVLEGCRLAPAVVMGQRVDVVVIDARYSNYFGLIEDPRNREW